MVCDIVETWSRVLKTTEKASKNKAWVKRTLLPLLMTGELIDANFGQEPFVFDIEGEMKESQLRIHRTIENFPPPGKHGDWELLLHKMVSSYLVHQGFAATAEAFANSTAASNSGTPLDIGEDFASIRNRQVLIEA